MAEHTIHPASAREVVALIADASVEELDSLCERYADDPRKQVQKAITSAKRRRENELTERHRVDDMYALQAELGGSGYVVGVDEVGRGAVAGPLTVGAVVLPREPHIWGLNDSKQLSPSRREVLADQIGNQAIAIGIAHIEPQVIDAIGMAQALRLAMAQAIEKTGVEPDCVLIDGNPVHVHPKEKCVVKGDARIACIAAASIVAKVTRDALMVAYDSEYPGYHLAHSKGYASAEHIKAIQERGLTPLHRVSFCQNFLKTPSLF